MKKLLVLLALVALPLSAIAQEAGNTTGDTTLQPNLDQINVPSTEAGGNSSTGSSTQFGLVIKSINKSTGRLLGGVKITLASADDKGEVTIPDPPKEPEGELAFKALPGTYTVTATRNGYESVTEQVTLESENVKLTLEMNPLSSTPNPQTEFAGRIQMLQIAQAINQNNTGNLLSGNYGGNPNIFGTNYNGLPTTQANYVYSQNQNNIVPLIVNIPSLSLISSLRNYDLRIIDPVLGNEVSLSNYNNPNLSNLGIGNIYASTTKYACIRPAQNYILRLIYQNNAFSVNQNNQDYNFQSAPLGGLTKIDISEQQIMAFVGGASTIATPQIQNLSTAGYSLPINCPGSYNNNGTFNGATSTWGDQSINGLQGNYSVQHSSYSDQYFLVNNNVYNDARPITFVENNAGDGGLAFVPAQSGNLYSPTYSSSQWYVTTYTRNISAFVSTCRSYINSLMTKTEFTNLDATLQATSKANYQNMTSSTLSNKEKLSLCLSTKTLLASGYQALSVAIPAMDSTETQVNVDTSKFTRVNFNPEEYKRAVAGQVLQNFNVK